MVLIGGFSICISRPSCNSSDNASIISDDSVSWTGSLSQLNQPLRLNAQYMRYDTRSMRKMEKG